MGLAILGLGGWELRPRCESRAYSGLRSLDCRKPITMNPCRVCGSVCSHRGCCENLIVDTISGISGMMRIQAN